VRAASSGTGHAVLSHAQRAYEGGAASGGCGKTDGGAIEVTVNDSKDTQDVQAIHSHLAHIVTMFSNGDFSLPMFVHSQVPPGVPVMKEKRRAISYTFEELPDGGRVRIKTEDRDALKVVHDFLRFQIEDHHTEDKPE
jgi:hypothetical protein